MKVLGEIVLCRFIPENKGGLIIVPDDVKLQNTVKGEVAHIGTVMPDGYEFEVGDIVQWHAHRGMWEKIEGETFCILRPLDIICKLDKVVN